MENINELRQELGAKFIRLGEEMHAKIRNGETVSDELAEISKKISILEKQIHDLNGKSIPHKDQGKCPKCGAEYAEGAFFCGECGLNIKEYYERDTDYCPTCSGITIKASNYCSICGTKLSGNARVG